MSAGTFPADTSIVVTIMEVPQPQIQAKPKPINRFNRNLDRDQARDVTFDLSGNLLLVYMRCTNSRQ